MTMRRAIWSPRPLLVSDSWRACSTWPQAGRRKTQHQELDPRPASFRSRSGKPGAEIDRRTGAIISGTIPAPPLGIALAAMARHRVFGRKNRTIVANDPEVRVDLPEVPPASGRCTLTYIETY